MEPEYQHAPLLSRGQRSSTRRRARRLLITPPRLLSRQPAIVTRSFNACPATTTVSPEDSKKQCLFSKFVYITSAPCAYNIFCLMSLMPARIRTSLYFSERRFRARRQSMTRRSPSRRCTFNVSRSSQYRKSAPEHCSVSQKKKTT